MEAERALPSGRRVPRPGDLIAGRYRVRSELGRGGAGAVFAARDEANERSVALKMLLPRKSEDPFTELRFRREFHKMAGLVHPRIVVVHDYGVDDGRPFYTMELLEGRDLRELDRMPAREVCRVMRDVASALAFMHTRQLIHRDVSPRNVRLTPEGDAKLIDFGLLATSGVAPGEMGGTPPYMAPETLRPVPLDHRVDLYSLGAVGYRLLTGQNAFQVSSFEDLAEAHKLRPPPPSSLAPDVPPAMDELILALLSPSPLARPSSAAEVIDRVAAIGGLEATPELETARGYLVNATLVGREAELAQIKAAVRGATNGDAKPLVVEGASGAGKSRILRELVLEAQVAGAIAVHVDCDAAGQAPYAVLREIAARLLAVLPEVTRTAAEPYAGVIGRALPEIRRALPRVRTEPPRGEPAEDRLRLHGALASFLLALAHARTLALVLDDAQRCDASSAAVLAAVVKRADRPLVAGAVRSDEAPRAESLVHALREAGTTIRLGGLGAEATLSLVRATFGEAPNAPRLARWLESAARGSPLVCAEALRELVEGGVLRYEGGLWHIPERLPERGARELSEAMDARVRALDPKTRAFAEALAVHGGEIPLEIAVALGSEDVAFTALDELMRSEFLVAADERYRFRHDGVREALLRSIDAARLRELHGAVGRALLAQGERGREAEIGWHLYKGDDRARGATLLEKAGRDFYAAQSFAEAIPALEAALERYDEEKRPPKVCLELRRLIIGAGGLAGREALFRHGDRAVRELETLSGVAAARRARRFVGPRLGLAFGLLWAWIRWLCAGPWRLPTPIAAITDFIVCVSYLAVATATIFDYAASRALAEKLEPFSVLGRRIPNGAYLMARAFFYCQIGKWRAARSDCRTLLDILDTDKVTPLPAIERAMARGGAHFIKFTLEAQDEDPRFDEEKEKMLALDLRFFALSADVATAAFHRMRGEEAKAEELAQKADVGFLESGSFWILEAQSAWQNALARVCTRDVVSLKRAMDRAQALRELDFNLGPLVALLRGALHRERGEHAEAKRAFADALAPLPEDETYLREPILAGLAETHLAAGEIDDARTIARACVALADESGRFTWRARAGRVLALADAAEGLHADALARLAELVSEAEPLGSPSTMTELHEARARVALAAGDRDEFDRHVLAARAWAAPTENPALVRVVDQLAALVAPTSSAPIVSGEISVSDVRTADAQDPESLLAILAEATGANAAFAFRLEGEALRVKAPAGAVPSEELVQMLEQLVLAARHGDSVTSARVEHVAGSARRAWRPYVLRADAERIVGAVALAVPDGALAAPRPLLKRLADAFAR